jgi:hypothetical protein
MDDFAPILRLDDIDATRIKPGISNSMARRSSAEREVRSCTDYFSRSRRWLMASWGASQTSTTSLCGNGFASSTSPLAGYWIRSGWVLGAFRVRTAARLASVRRHPSDFVVGTPSPASAGPTVRGCVCMARSSAAEHAADLSPRTGCDGHDEVLGVGSPSRQNSTRL